MTQQTHTLHISGTHCSACKHLIEDILEQDKTILETNVHLTNETITVTTKDTIQPENLAEHLTQLLSTNGYRVYTDKPNLTNTTHDWYFALPLVGILLLGFLFLEKAGFTSLLGTSEGTFATSFLVGLIASVSTCLAIVGGLVLSVSATYARDSNNWYPQAFFHTGRLLGFFVLGGLLGTLGEVVQLGFYGSAFLGGVASLVMLVLGIHLLDVFKQAQVPTLPKRVSVFFRTMAHKTGKFAPFALGASTFFLPCGFTQSMQVVSLSSGSFVTGATTMFVFALGTLPVLGLLSFGSLNLAQSIYRGIFFKTAGMLVIAFALFNLQNVLVVFDLINPLIHF